MAIGSKFAGSASNLLKIAPDTIIKKTVKIGGSATGAGASRIGRVTRKGSGTIVDASSSLGTSAAKAGDSLGTGFAKVGDDLGTGITKVGDDLGTGASKVGDDLGTGAAKGNKTPDLDSQIAKGADDVKAGKYADEAGEAASTSAKKQKSFIKKHGGELAVVGGVAVIAGVALNKVNEKQNFPMEIVRLSRNDGFLFMAGTPELLTVQVRSATDEDLIEIQMGDTILFEDVAGISVLNGEKCVISAMHNANTFDVNISHIVDYEEIEIPEPSDVSGTCRYQTSFDAEANKAMADAANAVGKTTGSFLGSTVGGLTSGLFAGASGAMAKSLGVDIESAKTLVLVILFVVSCIAFAYILNSLMGVAKATGMTAQQQPQQQQPQQQPQQQQPQQQWGMTPQQQWQQQQWQQQQQQQAQQQAQQLAQQQAQQLAQQQAQQLAQQQAQPLAQQQAQPLAQQQAQPLAQQQAQ